MPINYTEDEIPEDQPTSQGFTFPGQIEDFGFAETPSFKKEGPYPVSSPKMFVYGINPLSFSYDRNPESWMYEQQENLRRYWLKYLNDKGEPINANSIFGIVKAAFQTLGYPLRNATDATALRGKKFMFRNEEHKFGDSKPISIDVPVSELPDDYVFTGNKRDPIRQGWDGAPVVDAKQEEADVPVLKRALEGKSPSEFILAISQEGSLGAYIQEASAGEPLINRMKRHGMDLVDGKLVSV